MPTLSKLYQSRQPSNIRLASIEFAKRTDGVEALNVAIGNVSLPMHPAMIKAMNSLNSTDSPFKDGVVKYTATVGTNDCNNAFMKILQASSIDTSKLFSQVTDGGSQAMELVIAGVASKENPVMLLDPAYSNYTSFADRLSLPYISVERTLQENGEFTLASLEEIEKKIIENKPSALIVIPFDNPTGQLIKYEQMIELAKLCVKYDMWLISDEAYRELYYTNIQRLPSVWNLTENEVKGIEGRRISIESSSKVWNACGLRIGAIITDNKEFNTQCIAEQTANLCANAIGQYIFSAIENESLEDLQSWFKRQREYYQEIVDVLSAEFKTHLPMAIVSKPEAALYSVIDLKNIVNDDFKINDFVLYCARKGSIVINGKEMTLLTAPMSNKTQLRIAYVLGLEEMRLVPELLSKLLKDYLQ